MTYFLLHGHSTNISDVTLLFFFSDYLEEAFPDKPQLYPSDPVKKSKQKIIVETMGKAVVTLFFSAILLYFGDVIFAQFRTIRIHTGL